jgi:glyoxylase-like metal-dependent hydrolase (beta-lactamase superfamily II)
MADVLENHRRHGGALSGRARVFRHGDGLKWEECDFEVTHAPGHTEYQTIWLRLGCAVGDVRPAVS